MVLAAPSVTSCMNPTRRRSKRWLGNEYKLPILFYPQVLGLAMGMEPEELGIKMNRVRPTELLKKINPAVAKRS